jgi:hypothetical protein
MWRLRVFLGSGHAPKYPPLYRGVKGLDLKLEGLYGAE